MKLQLFCELHVSELQTVKPGCTEADSDNLVIFSFVGNICQESHKLVT